jgi:hypothetical protein
LLNMSTHTFWFSKWPIPSLFTKICGYTLMLLWCSAILHTSIRNQNPLQLHNVLISILIYTLCVCAASLHHFTSTQLQMQLNLASCSHQVPKGFHKFPSCSPKTFLITPEFYPIWFAQSSTLMYINWKHIFGSTHIFEVKIF